MALQMLRQFERALESQGSKKAVIELMDMVVRSVPIRYAEPDRRSVSKGEVYGLESAEDTSPAGQRVPATTKASLQRFIPPILSQLDKIDPYSLEKLYKDPSMQRILAAMLFRLGHAAASFRPYFVPLNAPIPQFPSPPELAAPSRPAIALDQDLEFLHETSKRIANLAKTLCGYNASKLLSLPNTISNQRIHATSDTIPYDPTNRIEIPAISERESDFNLAGVAACLFEIVRDSPSIPDEWLIFSPKGVMELLLQHVQVLLTSRSLASLNFMDWILDQYASQPLYDIAYPTSYILEHEILPIGMPLFVHQVVRASIEFGIRMPDTRLRQSIMSSIHRFIQLLNVPSRYKLIYLLVKTSPYPTTHGLLIHLMKEEFLAEHSSAEPNLSKSHPFFNTELIFDFLGKTVLSIKGLESRSDAVTAGLNFLRAILLCDSQRRLTTLWEHASKFKNEVLMPLNNCTLQIINQHLKDDSYEDRQRIRKEISSKGMGNMSVDQLAQSQSQTILSWQLIHSLIQRIEELMPG
jgi:hypothetical protein